MAAEISPYLCCFEANGQAVICYRAGLFRSHLEHQRSPWCQPSNRFVRNWQQVTKSVFTRSKRHLRLPIGNDGW